MNKMAIKSLSSKQEEDAKALERYVNVKSMQIVWRYSSNEITYQDAIEEIQALCKVVLDAGEENGHDKGKVFGYRQCVIDYRRMQEKGV